MRSIVPVKGRLFTVAEAAQYLGVTVSRIRKLLARRELVSMRTDADRLQGIFQADCDLWVEAHRRVPAPARRPGQIAVDERMAALMPPPSERIFG